MAINRGALWVEASDGKFGFSVQKKIYVDDCGGQPNGQYDEEAWYCFAEKVGWRVTIRGSYTWLNYSQLTFDTTAPTGHLPSGRQRSLTVWGNFSSRSLLSCRDL